MKFAKPFEIIRFEHFPKKGEYNNYPIKNKRLNQLMRLALIHLDRLYTII